MKDGGGHDVVPVREDISLHDDDISNHAFGGKPAVVDLRRHTLDQDTATTIERITLKHHEAIPGASPVPV